MSRYANGVRPTNEYQACVEYDAGYRDGYRAASERSKAELEVLRAQLDAIVRRASELAALSPVITVAIDSASPTMPQASGSARS
ncbi:hypothetical protein [Burkholderia ambifaria]|uniref:hypothetical protein n=1 Tax=Burkholderia ambifaria TaxID=152480 RepID=UPI001BA0AD9C|nr:hypothetical protein [Burkholderia ambifaria]MBR7929416.1 hypothetical protein [Burkholderia ambifaria]